MTIFKDCCSYFLEVKTDRLLNIPPFYSIMYCDGIGVIEARMARGRLVGIPAEVFGKFGPVGSKTGLGVTILNADFGYNVGLINPYYDLISDEVAKLLELRGVGFGYGIDMARFAKDGSLFVPRRAIETAGLEKAVFALVTRDDMIEVSSNSNFNSLEVGQEGENEFIEKYALEV